ncbi:MAG: hypothetical protein AB7I18_00950 [Candidatus Berkiella sp.]
MINFLNRTESLRTLEVNGKPLHFVQFLHHGSGGLTSIYQDENKQKYILKSTLGEEATTEAELNNSLGRLVAYEKGKEGWEHLVLKYIDGIDAERYLAEHLSQPAMDDIGCALFDPRYLNSPCLGFKRGLDRNITMAIELIKVQEALAKQNIVHTDVQLANYIVNETAEGIQIEGIDLQVAVDLTKLPSKKQKTVISENVDSLIEALKAILPKENYLTMQAVLAQSEEPSYAMMVSALEGQLSAKALLKKSYTPSFSGPQTNLLPEIVVSPRHKQFIKSRLEGAIRKNNVDQAYSYVLHGASLDERMMKDLMLDDHKAMQAALKPYIQEFESNQLAAAMSNLNLKPHS